MCILIKTTSKASLLSKIYEELAARQLYFLKCSLSRNINLIRFSKVNRFLTNRDMNSDIRTFMAETEDVIKTWNGESGEWEIQIGIFFFF